MIYRFGLDFRAAATGTFFYGFDTSCGFRIIVVEEGQFAILLVGCPFCGRLGLQSDSFKFDSHVTALPHSSLGIVKPQIVNPLFFRRLSV